MNKILTITALCMLIPTAFAGGSGYPEKNVPCSSVVQVQDYLLNVFTDQGMLLSERTANTIAFEKTQNMSFGQVVAQSFIKGQQGNYQNKFKIHFTVIPLSEPQTGMCRLVMHTIGIANPGTTSQSEYDVSQAPENQAGMEATLERFKEELSAQQPKPSTAAAGAQGQ